MITSKVSYLLKRVFMGFMDRWSISPLSDDKRPHRRMVLRSLDKQTLPVVLTISHPDEINLPDDTVIYVNGKQIGTVLELGPEAQVSACALYSRLRKKEGAEVDTTAETLQRILISDL